MSKSTDKKRKTRGGHGSSGNARAHARAKRLLRAEVKRRMLCPRCKKRVRNANTWHRTPKALRGEKGKWCN